MKTDGTLSTNLPTSENTMTLNETQAGQRARQLHQTGYHCAEAVLVAVLETAAVPDNSMIPRIATCFGAGVGRTREEMCGALTGGLMAIGCLLGRDRKGQNWDVAAQAAADLCQQFRALYGSTRCSEILSAMGPQDNGHLCKQLSATTASFASCILNSSQL
jgi:C_GCAxxG_C_C family probable redox protein